MLTTTGVPGLDLVLGGGLERGAVVVLAGAPGTGDRRRISAATRPVSAPSGPAVLGTVVASLARRA